jgi:hypothetical protein
MHGGAAGAKPGSEAVACEGTSANSSNLEMQQIADIYIPEVQHGAEQH